MILGSGVKLLKFATQSKIIQEFGMNIFKVRYQRPPETGINYKIVNYRPNWKNIRNETFFRSFRYW